FATSATVNRTRSGTAPPCEYATRTNWCDTLSTVNHCPNKSKPTSVPSSSVTDSTDTTGRCVKYTCPPLTFNRTVEVPAVKPCPDARRNSSDALSNTGSTRTASSVVRSRPRTASTSSADASCTTAMTRPPSELDQANR